MLRVRLDEPRFGQEPRQGRSSVWSASSHIVPLSTFLAIARYFYHVDTRDIVAPSLEDNIPSLSGFKKALGKSQEGGSPGQSRETDSI
jgi:hypothetical protein